jgi:hypothetical protein
MSKSSQRRYAAATLAVGLLALSAALIGGASGADAAPAARTTIVLGKTATTPDASCPESPCRAIGSVTGFQIRNQEGSLPFRVPRNGEITAWSVNLSKPTDNQRAFFNGFFGRPPEAHLAILKRVPASDPPRYRLRRQSPIEVLSGQPGGLARFSLDQPLRVRRGNVVALSIPTWIPAFAFDLSPANAWRASRQPGHCTNATDLRQGTPQQVVGSRRAYGCRYNGARLLYTATLVVGG